MSNKNTDIQLNDFFYCPFKVRRKLQRIHLLLQKKRRIKTYCLGVFGGSRSIPLTRFRAILDLSESSEANSTARCSQLRKRYSGNGKCKIAHIYYYFDMNYLYWNWQWLHDYLWKCLYSISANLTDARWADEKMPQMRNGVPLAVASEYRVGYVDDGHETWCTVP